MSGFDRDDSVRPDLPTEALKLANVQPRLVSNNDSSMGYPYQQIYRLLFLVTMEARTPELLSRFLWEPVPR